MSTPRPELLGTSGTLASTHRPAGRQPLRTTLLRAATDPRDMQGWAVGP